MRAVKENIHAPDRHALEAPRPCDKRQRCLDLIDGDAVVDICQKVRRHDGERSIARLMTAEK